MRPCLSVGAFQQHLEKAGVSLDGHLAVCAKCRAASERLAATNTRVDTWLSALALPMEDVPLDITGVLARVTRPRQVDHVAALLAPDLVDIPWYLSLYRNLLEIARPPKLPPLNVTSRPIAVREIWGLYDKDPKSRYLSLAIHAAVFALLMVGATNKTVQRSIRDRFDLIDPAIRPYIPEKAQGGGGGGSRQPLPVSAGQAPKPSMKQFVPPQIVEQPPKLAMTPTIVAPPDAVLPQNNLPNWGDPLAKLSTLSNGPGSGGGMGSGNGGGLGSGNGTGFGPGSGGGFGGGVFRVGGGVSAPVLVFKTDPEYSEEARKAKYSGNVILAVVVDTEGRAREVRVVKSLGMGLDEKAIEAVRNWRFKPGMKGGQAVNVRATIEVNFRLL